MALSPTYLLLLYFSFCLCGGLCVISAPDRTQDGEFSLNLLRVTDTGDASVFGSFTPNQNIVNFLWSVVDVPNNRYIQLVGNENTAWDLQALLFIYDLTTGEIANKVLIFLRVTHVAQYSFSFFLRYLCLLPTNELRASSDAARHFEVLFQ